MVALAVVKLPVLAVVAPIAVPSMYPPVTRALAVLKLVATSVIILPFVALTVGAVNVVILPVVAFSTVVLVVCALIVGAVNVVILPAVAFTVVALVVYESTVVALAVVKLPVLAVVAPIAVPSM